MKADMLSAIEITGDCWRTAPLRVPCQ
jgi:hypothetical protein